MTTFLITTTDGIAIRRVTFLEVQEEMIRLEKGCVISNVKVQRFENNLLNKEFTYNYNGEAWEKK